MPKQKIQKLSSKPGVSLVEVILVLGISSMMIGGSLLWFQSKKSSDYFDSSRRVESQIRIAQNDNVTSNVLGYNSTDAAGSGCNSAARVGCVPLAGEEVYGTAIAAAPVPLTSTTSQIRTFYLKQESEKTPGGAAYVWPDTQQAERIYDYTGATPKVDTLPGNMIFSGFKVYGPDIATGKCTRASYRDLKRIDPTDAANNVKTFTSADNAWSMIVFRRATGAYNAFFGTSGAANLYTAAGSWPNPPFAGGSRPNSKPSLLQLNTLATYPSNASWRGNYEDSYKYPISAGDSLPLPSRPCAVLWLFDSVDKTSGTTPRFTSEINFNFVDNTTTAQSVLK